MPNVPMHLSKLAVGEPQVLADIAARGREVLARDVGDEIHQAQQTEDDRWCRDALTRHGERA